MYLRGKLPPEEQTSGPDMGTPPEDTSDDLERSIEYPTEDE